MIYLDHNATTPTAVEVVEALLPYLTERFGNPSSRHALGRDASRAIAEAREQVAALIGARSDEIVFTSGGTEASNLALRGAARRLGRGRIVTTTVEHPATTAPCAELGREGFEVVRAPVDSTGRVTEDTARPLFTETTKLVTIIHANNETGTLQPVRWLAALAKEQGAIVHTDAAQSVGKIPVNVDDLGVDLLSIAGHKLRAPKGVGALYVRAGTPLSPLVVGAGHERGLRPGTENVAFIVALGAACDLARRELDQNERRVRALRDDLHARLLDGIPGLALNGHPELRLPNTLNARFPGASGAAILERAEIVAASLGSACHEASDTPSAVLVAMGLDGAAARESVRLSLGATTTAAEVERAAIALRDAWRAVTLSPVGSARTEPSS